MLQQHPNGRRYSDWPTFSRTVIQVTLTSLNLSACLGTFSLVIKYIVIEQGEPIKSVLPMKTV